MSADMETNNTNIEYFEKLISPHDLLAKMPITEEMKSLVSKTRNAIKDIISRKDGRLLFIVGPCSIHNIEEAKKYGEELKKIADKVADRILIVMRVYFEKPRTTIGWKGLINDPDLDGTCNVNKGLHMARELLLYLNGIGMPCGYEVLDTITPQYICDLISWGAVGARTVESQVHRQLVSGLSMPVGFKNGTGGSIDIAADAILSAAYPQCFMGITDHGEPSICKTRGNRDCHIILRGNKLGPNYEKEHIIRASGILESRDIKPSIMVDCSHGNSGKDHTRQHIVLENVMEQIAESDETPIIGVMIESYHNPGKQKITAGKDILPGISVTDACIGLFETDKIITKAYDLFTF